MSNKGRTESTPPLPAELWGCMLRLHARPQHPLPLGMGPLLSLGDKETDRHRDRRPGRPDGEATTAG